ncbi:MAG: substrate-binding periplasmic protein [Solidesulfovibrio sp. DCME]|uniref:substrate-binding periplasmic protein n=1 Tax=Solidesulfovibrio sp. DCME TaxID=3447380 RepID=UPI003D0A3471
MFDRPPYYRLRNGQPAGGFLLDLSLAVLDHSAIPYVVRELPAARVTATFANEVVNACGTGWFRTPEREGFARFSTPLYQDRPLVAAVNASAGACPESTTLARLLDEKKHWGLRGGFSYGPAIDARLAALPDDRIHRFNDAAAMLALVARGRLDAMLIEPEELAWLVGRHPEYAGTVCALALEDAPPGNGRHIMCDASVSPDTMARIDAAIVEFVGEDAQRARCLVALRH